MTNLMHDCSLPSLQIYFNSKKYLYLQLSLILNIWVNLFRWLFYLNIDHSSPALGEYDAWASHQRSHIPGNYPVLSRPDHKQCDSQTEKYFNSIHHKVSEFGFQFNTNARATKTSEPGPSCGIWHPDKCGAALIDGCFIIKFEPISYFCLVWSIVRGHDWSPTVTVSRVSRPLSLCNMIPIWGASVWARLWKLSRRVRDIVTV